MVSVTIDNITYDIDTSNPSAGAKITTGSPDGLGTITVPYSIEYNYQTYIVNHASDFGIFKTGPVKLDFSQATAVTSLGNQAAHSQKALSTVIMHYDLMFSGTDQFSLNEKNFTQVIISEKITGFPTGSSGWASPFRISNYATDTYTIEDLQVITYENGNYVYYQYVGPALDTRYFNGNDERVISGQEYRWNEKFFNDIILPFSGRDYTHSDTTQMNVITATKTDASLWKNLSAYPLFYLISGDLNFGIHTNSNYANLKYNNTLLDISFGSTQDLPQDTDITVSMANPYLFNSVAYDVNTKIAMTVGTYTFTGITTAHPLGFVIDNIDLFEVTSGTVYGTKTIDGISVVHYTGTIVVQVKGNFGTISYNCYHHGYMGGEDRLVFYTPTLSFSSNTKNHLAMTFDNSFVNVYVNGIKMKTDLSGTSSYNKILLNSSSGTGAAKGYYDDFKIYNKVLTDSEVNDIYNIEEYIVTVSNECFLFDGTVSKDISFVTNKKYIFYQDDTSNVNNTLIIGNQKDISSSFIAHQTIAGTAGNPNAFTMFTKLDSDTSLNYMSWYNKNYIQRKVPYGFDTIDISINSTKTSILYAPFLVEYDNGDIVSVDSGGITNTSNVLDINGLSGVYTITTQVGGDLYDDLSSVSTVRLVNNIGQPYNSLARIHTDSTYRYVLTNYWPTFDNWDSYSSVNPNTPLPRDVTNGLVQVKLPVTPIYPANSNTYNYFSTEFGNSSEVTYSSITDVPQQFWSTALLGRFTTKNTHWKNTNTPQEIVVLDALPAATGGRMLGNTQPISTSTANYDNITATGATIDWDTKWVLPNYSNDTFALSDSDPGHTNARYRPGYYFRYFLNEVQGVLPSLLLDDYGGHTQPDGDWHLHTSTVFASADFSNCVVGYGLDGTPIMGGHSTVLNSTNTSIGLAEPSYRRRTTNEYTDSYSKNGNGYYTYDYIYDNTSGNLDEFNGGYAIIDNTLQYSYFITQTYPIWPRNIRGKITDLNIEI